MRLASIAYKEWEGRDQEWILDEVKFGQRNLLVGKNATGKTRVLNIIGGLAKLLAREMPPEILGKGPAIGIIATTDVRGYDKAQGLAAVNIVRRSRASDRHKNQRDKPQNKPGHRTTIVDKGVRRYETRLWRTSLRRPERGSSSERGRSGAKGKDHPIACAG